MSHSPSQAAPEADPKATPEAHLEATPEADLKATPEAGANHGRILVVDDEDSLLRVIARVLTRAGYEVSTASDGRHATEHLARTAFDAIVSDIDMPRMNGIKLLQTVRLHDPDVPVILMTGSPHLESARQAIAHGALLYLAKPIDMAQLTTALSRAVRLNRIARLKREALVLVNNGGLGAADRLALETSLERSLETLWMAFQPIVHVTSRSLFGYEALLRTEEKSLPHPGAIIEAAERLGRLDDLGRRIRAAICGPIPEADPQSVFFVNLHPRDLMDETLFSAESPLSAIANRVVLEITERASLDGITNVRAKVEALRQMGFRIAIDDLGSGYSGLTSFATLEPEFVKLDMSLIRDIDTSPRKEKLIRSLTTLCKDLGMTVVAEGVETVRERDVLQTIGCDLLQGYLLAKPGRPFPPFAW